MERQEIKIGLGQLEAALDTVQAISTRHKFTLADDTYWFGRTTQSLAPAFKKLTNAKNDLVSEYALKNADGTLKSGPEGVEIDPERKVEFETIWKELYARRIPRRVFLIQLSAFDDGGFTVNNLLPLMGLWIERPDGDEIPEEQEIG